VAAGALAIAVVVAIAVLSGTGEPPRLALTASMDATIREEAPASAFGDLDRLAVDAAPLEASLLRFDVTGIGGADGPLRTTLRLYATNGSSDGGRISLVPSDWDETDATWDRHGPPLADGAPAPGAVVADIGEVRPDRWVEIDLGALVGADGPYSLLITSTTGNGADYASRETRTPPKLIVEPADRRTPPPASPSVTTTPPASPSVTTTASPPPGDELTIAAVADVCGPDCDRVATLVRDAAPALVIAAGDLAYPDGTLEDYRESYDPAWGALKPITRSVPGNHEWHTPNAQGWRDYFGVPSGPTYGSFDHGGWHFIGLDSECSEAGGCTPGTPQYEWLVDDLAAMSERCSIAFYHHATFSDGQHGNTPNALGFWRAMDAAGVDVVLAGHDHTYQRFVPQRADGTEDPQGIRQFVVGTGGAGLYGFDVTPQPNREVGFSEHGALFLTLDDGSYSWEWKDLSGAVRDRGSADCV
jgi:hypothetical protein